MSGILLVYVLTFSVLDRALLQPKDYVYEVNDLAPNPLPCYFVKRSVLAAKRNSLADITSSVAPNSVCVFRSPTGSPTATRRRASSVTPVSKSKESPKPMAPVCPMKRRSTVHKMPGRLTKEGNGLSSTPELEYVPDDDEFSLDESSFDGLNREKLVALMGLQEKIDGLQLNNDFSHVHSKEG